MPDSSNLKTAHFNIFYQMNLPTKSDDRINWDDYFLLIAAVVSLRSTCIRRKYGSVIVKDNHIISTGYNGPPTGSPHCLDEGCFREKLNIPHGERYELCRAIHSEMNALIRGNPTDLKGATLYLVGYDCVTGRFIEAKPCALCEPACANAGLKDWVTKSEGLKGELFRRNF